MEVKIKIIDIVFSFICRVYKNQKFTRKPVYPWYNPDGVVQATYEL